MASTLCESSLLKHYPSVSPLSSLSKYYRKPSLGSSFLGSKSVKVLDFSAGTWKLVGDKRRRIPTVGALGGLLGGIFKGTDTGESTRQQYASTVSVINGLEAQMSALSDLELRDKTSVLKQRAQQGESLDSLLPVSS